MKNIFVGLDTSNYTTSLAILTEEGELLGNFKKLLPVKLGECGLRQSDAVFAHIKNLPLLFSEAASVLAKNRILAIGVSERPRNIDGSYMPCFLAGVNAAVAASTLLGVPLYKFSHQCGHIMAAIYSSGKNELVDSDFAAFHISGGTTELLRVTGAENGFNADHVGGTKDLNAGQIIDRIGVYMGLKFPSGREMEALALENKKKIPKKKISREGLFVNLSGLENLGKKLFDESKDKALTSAFVFECIGNAICDLTNEYISLHGDTHFVYAGGVMCNSLIKNKLKSKFNCSFAEPAMSADNAVGIACLARSKYMKN